MSNQLTTQAVLVDQDEINQKQMTMKLALFDAAGNPVVAADLTGTVLTGYTVGSNTALVDTDTLLEALGKLQAQLNAKKAAHQANSTASDVAGLVADFNALLAKLQAAGLMA